MDYDDDMTRDQLIDFLREAKEVDIENFDRDSPRTLQQLHDQIAGRDVKLIILKSSMPVAPEMVGRVLMVRSSVKVLFAAEQHVLLEEKRVYPANKTRLQPIVRESLKDFSISETIKRGETPICAAGQGMWRELQIPVFNDGEFDQASWPDGEIQPIRESTAYRRFLAQEIIHRVSLIWPERLWGEGRIYPDEGTEIHTRWYPYSFLMEKFPQTFSRLTRTELRRPQDLENHYMGIDIPAELRNRLKRLGEKIDD